MDNSLKIKILGVGAFGLSAIRYMRSMNCFSAEYIAIDSNTARLGQSDADIKIRFSEKVTSDEAATKISDRIQKATIECDLVILVSDMIGMKHPMFVCNLVSSLKWMGKPTIGVTISPYHCRAKGRSAISKTIDRLKGMIPCVYLPRGCEFSYDFSALDKRWDDIHRSSWRINEAPTENSEFIYWYRNYVKDKSTEYPKVVLILSFQLFRLFRMLRHEYPKTNTSTILGILSNSGDIHISSAIEGVPQNDEFSLRYMSDYGLRSQRAEELRHDSSFNHFMETDTHGAKAMLAIISTSSQTSKEEIALIVAHTSSFALDTAEYYFDIVVDESLGDKVRVDVLSTGKADFIEYY